MKKNRVRTSGVATAIRPSEALSNQSQNAWKTSDGAAWVFPAIVLLFFASGLSSLIYQVVWTRMLVLVFGATSFATSTVLSVFMGGLALGSFFAGRWSDRIKRPLLWYGILEAVIGLWALVTPGMFAAATPVYKWIWLQTHASIVPFSLLRFVCTAAILIVPTTCMGATLPLLARFVTTQLSNVGSRVGTLYAVNTLGAVIGGLVTGFMLLPALGLQATTITAAVVNFALLAGVVGIIKLAGGWATHGVARAIAPAPDAPATPCVARDGTAKPLTRPVAIALIAFAVSGGVAMIYEVCWTRTLLMVIGSSTYAFTVMLSAFLIGIFIGSLVCARFIDRVKKPLFLFALLQLAIGVLTLISMREFNYIPFWNLWISSNYKLDNDALMLIRFLLSGSVLIPVTLCLGAIFPTVVKACTADLAAVGRSVGTLYSANTLGAIIGAFIAGFVCLPAFGAENTLLYGALVNAALGLLLLWGATNRDDSPAASILKDRRVVISAAAALMMLLCFSTGGMWDHSILLNVQSSKRRLMTSSFNYTSFEEWRDDLHRQFDVKYWADGPCSNVGIIFSKDFKVTGLVTNGHIDASDDADQPVQSLVSGFPMLVKPHVKDMAVIGWGCGQTVGTATLFPVNAIEAIELEPHVIDASKFFHHVNRKPEQDPRVHLQFNDGRNYMLATDKKFDLIVSEPSNPWQAGVCNLFTTEYFSICKQRLAQHGLLSVWMQISEVPPSDVCAVISSLRANFKHLLAFYPRPGNLVVLAADEPIQINLDEVKGALADKECGAEYKRVGISCAEDLIAHIAIASDGIEHLVASARQNTDDKNQLEFDVGKSYETTFYLPQNQALLSSMAGNPWSQVDWGGMPQQERADFMARVGARCYDLNNEGLARQWLAQSLQIAPTARAYRSLGMIMSNYSNDAGAYEMYSKALALKPNDKETLVLRGSALLKMNKRTEARDDFHKVLSQESTPNVRYMLALTYSPLLVGDRYTKEEYAKHEDQPAREVLKLLSGLDADKEFVKHWPVVNLLIAQSNFKLGNAKIAKNSLDEYMKVVPDSVPGKLLKRAIQQADVQ